MNYVVQVVSFLTLANTPAGAPSVAFIYPPGITQQNCEASGGRESAERLLLPEARRKGFTRAMKVQVMCLSFTGGPQRFCDYWRRGGLECFQMEAQ